jgi:hypothetical protein
MNTEPAGAFNWLVNTHIRFSPRDVTIAAATAEGAGAFEFERLVLCSATSGTRCDFRMVEFIYSDLFP